MKPTTTIGRLCACASLRVWVEEYGCFCVTPVDFGPLSGNATMGSETCTSGQREKSLERSWLTRPWSLRAALRDRRRIPRWVWFALCEKWRNLCPFQGSHKGKTQCVTQSHIRNAYLFLVASLTLQSLCGPPVMKQNRFCPCRCWPSSTTLTLLSKISNSASSCS